MQHNNAIPDPRLARAIQALDAERNARIKAERGQRALRNALRRVIATRDAEAQKAAEAREATIKAQAKAQVSAA
jgi:hypothetical protein